MDDLIVILVRAIANWISGRNATAKTPPAYSNPRTGGSNQVTANLPPQWQDQVRRITQEAAIAQQKALKKRGGKKGLPPKLPPQTTPAAVREIVSPSAATVNKPAASRAVTASALLAPLHASLNATALRRQFIMTEILQPPLALRDSK